jgi:type I restriction enzyme S subunit
MSNDWFFEKFALIADAPGAVTRMRELVLDLAMKGKVTDRNQNSEYVDANYINEPYSEVLPSNWRLLNFGKFCDIQGGSQPPKEQFIDKPRSDYVQMFQIRDLGEKPVPVYIPRDSTTRFCSEGDILIGRYGASVGKIFWAQNGTYNVALAKFIFPKDAFVPAFAFWLLKSDFFQAKLAGASRSAQAGFNKGDLAGITFPLPPLAEQKRIVAKVDELMGLCDALAAQQQERELRRSVLVRSSLSRFAESPTPENLGYLFHKSYDIPPSELRKSILTLAVQGLLVAHDSESADWGTKRLKDLTTKIGSGSTPSGGKESYQASGVPLIRSMNVHFGGFVRQGLAFLNDEQAEKLKNVAVKADDVLLNITGASIGRVATAPRNMEGARVNQHVCIIRPTSEITPQFLELFLASPVVQNLIETIQVGGTREALTKAMIEQFEIPVPSIAEQRRIVAKVDQLMALVDELERQQEASREKATKLLDAIVHEMTSGGRCIAATLES